MRGKEPELTFMKKKRTYSKKQSKALFKRHFQSLDDPSSISTEWPQSMAHSSMKKRTKYITKQQKVDAYKDSLFEKALQEALNRWENERSSN